MRHWSGTGRRLFFAFASLIAIYGAASMAGLAALSEIHDGLHQTRERAGGVRLALELASAVRDQYAHQAHTIILGDDTHLGFYRSAHARVLELTKAVAVHARGEEERAWVRDIETASAELDRIFLERIVPAVLDGSRDVVQAEHARAQEQVAIIQGRTERLVEEYERTIDGLQDHVTAVEHETFRWTLALIVSAPLIAIAIGVYIGRSVTRPVSALQAGAARIAEGDLATRIPVDTPDEFGELARQFNAMTAALKEHQEKLVQHEKLAGIGRLAAGVAHEINNPLGVILGYVRVMRRKADVPLAEDLSVVEEEALRCKEIVEGLLELSRPMRGDAAPVELRELCDEVVSRLREARTLDGVEVDLEGAGAVQGFPQKLRQVVLNLVANAAEAAGEGGRVVVRVAATGEGTQLSVEDDGPGVAPEAMEKLFEPFFTTKPSGTGLGLAVSQAIAEAHGGQIAAGRSRLGGACFTVTLPAAENRPRANRTAS